MTVGENGDVVAADEEMPVLLQDAAESWDLFGASKLGRLAANVGVQPEIFPINYPEHTDAAWSVIVKGTVHSRQREIDIEGAKMLPLHSWIPTIKYIFVEITPGAGHRPQVCHVPETRR
ncbi:hypothetical protein ABIE18_004246 [Arthrobacter sp. 2762]